MSCYLEAGSNPDSGSDKVERNLNTVWHTIEVDLLSIDGPPESSADLDWAAVPRQEYMYPSLPMAPSPSMSQKFFVV